MRSSGRIDDDERNEMREKHLNRNERCLTLCCILAIVTNSLSIVDNFTRQPFNLYFIMHSILWRVKMYAECVAREFNSRNSIRFHCSSKSENQPNIKNLISRHDIQIDIISGTFNSIWVYLLHRPAYLIDEK